MIWLAIALAGALGAVARYLVDLAVSTRTGGSELPVGTLVINVSGSLLAGIVVALVTTTALPDALGTVMAGGFLGAYTTFSTAMYETARLLEQGSHRTAVTNLVVPLVASVAAAAGGVWLVVQVTGG